eukprot:349679-Chlamydomonas_euryale.AAC.7
MPVEAETALRPRTWECAYPPATLAYTLPLIGIGMCMPRAAWECACHGQHENVHAAGSMGMCMLRAAWECVCRGQHGNVHFPPAALEVTHKWNRSLHATSGIGTCMPRIACERHDPPAPPAIMSPQSDPVYTCLNASSLHKTDVQGNCHERRPGRQVLKGRDQQPVQGWSLRVPGASALMQVCLALCVSEHA